MERCRERFNILNFYNIFKMQLKNAKPDACNVGIKSKHVPFCFFSKKLTIELNKGLESVFARIRKKLLRQCTLNMGIKGTKQVKGLILGTIDV